MILTRIIRDIEGRDGLFNMAADAFLADVFAEVGVSAIIRVYTWNPPAVSLGANQKPDCIDWERCRAEGWDLVRRPTGGRALLHDGDLSYSIVVPASKDSFTELRCLYDGVAEALIRMLARGGIAADNTRISARHSLNDISPRARLCMGSRSRGEAHVGGRKVCGASQRVFRNCILQHGSIPLRGDIAAIAKISTLPDNAKREAAEMIRREAAALEDIGFPLLEPSEVAGLLIEELQRQFSFELIERNWTASEEREIDSLKGGFRVEACAPTVEAYG